MTEDSFVQAILDEPEAREHYLVFADWLEEQGETARSHLIRRTLELERLRRNDPQLAPLAEEVKHLQSQVEASWPTYQAWAKVFGISWEKGLPSGAWLQTDWPTAKTLRSLPLFPYLRTLTGRELPSPDLANLLIERTADLCFHYDCLSDDQFATLADYPGVKGLRLYDEGRLTDDHLAQLAPLTELRTLNLYADGITDAGVEHLRAFGKLQRLGLGNSQLTDAGLQALLAIPGLKKRLTSLDLDRTKITGKAIDMLVKFSQLRSLSLDGIEAINDENVVRLANLPELRDLTHSQTGVTRYHMRRLATFPKLERIRTLASLAITHESEEVREIEAFFADMREADVFVDVDYE